MQGENYFSNIPLNDVQRIVTPIDASVKFPEILDILLEKYRDDINLFQYLVLQSTSSEELLGYIRSAKYDAKQRMSLLKMFRRCVSPVCDTEATKKIKTIPTYVLVEAYGPTFKPIDELQSQFANISSATMSALAVLIGEYDTRGQSGYALTDLFFNWFSERHGRDMIIEGPRGAGRDIELSTIFPNFVGQYPLDFVIRLRATGEVLAVGFARYDATRGGAQSDDRTGGNSNKVMKAKEYNQMTGDLIKLIFLSDGPGLMHRDTWMEACNLDSSWGDNVRVTTLKTANARVTREWLLDAISDSA
ncbi:hypothetical protein IFT86_04230 [Pseudomonas syringae]|uniref:hypothetical protein n=1 Tax=Pseudomonas syringae TaxID=317 RepID=UPI00177EBA7D|nr:hypothetical protein [Pseudomonas syringae]